MFTQASANLHPEMTAGRLALSTVEAAL
jgi:hypothetical protein